MLAILAVLLLIGCVDSLSLPSRSVCNSVRSVPSFYRLQATNANVEEGVMGQADRTVAKTFSVGATVNYITATGLQFALLLASMKGVEKYVLPAVTNMRVKGIPGDHILVVASMLALSLRSRIFSPLNNSRPKATLEDPIFKNRLRPWWQPPPRAFPVIWSCISVLRTISAFLIYKTTGSVTSAPLLAFFAHLCIGDTWNTINNIEGRMGTAFLGVLFVLASVYNAIYQYYQTLPLAAYVLAPSGAWLSIATVLIFSIWRLNYERAGRPSFLPSKEEGPPSKWRFPLAALAIIM